MSSSWFVIDWTSECLFLVPQTPQKLVSVAWWLPHEWQYVYINEKSPWNVFLQLVANVANINKSSFHSKRSFRLETQFLDWKHHFYIRNKIFRLETGFLDWKRDFLNRNEIFRLETRFLDWKHGF